MKPGNCPECDSEDVEICSGDAVMCNACGHVESFENWERIAEGKKAFEAGGQEWADWNMANNPFGDEP